MGNGKREKACTSRRHRDVPPLRSSMQPLVLHLPLILVTWSKGEQSPARIRSPIAPT